MLPTEYPREILKLVDFQSCSIQSDSSSPSEAISPSLKLVVSNSLPIQEKAPSQTMNSNAGFKAEIRKRSPYLYALVARDPFHYLDSTLILEIEENLPGSVAVICKFPHISDEKLTDFIEEDETLHGMILIQFQMKIMEQLLLFCTSYKASTLMVHVDEAQSNGMGIYEQLVTYEDKVPAQKGNLIQLTIPVKPQALETWANYMGVVNEKFRQTLWHDQCENPTIRNYLKSNPHLSIVR